MPFPDDKLFNGFSKSASRPLSGSQMERVLKRLGWECKRMEGSHRIYKNHLIWITIAIAPDDGTHYTAKLVARKSKDCGYNHLDLEGKLADEVLVALFLERCIAEAGPKGKWDAKKIDHAWHKLDAASRELKKLGLLETYYKHTEHKLLPENYGSTKHVTICPPEPSPTAPPSQAESFTTTPTDVCTICEKEKINESVGESVIYEGICVECERTACHKCASVLFVNSEPKDHSESGTCLACYKPLPSLLTPVSSSVPPKLLITHCCACEQPLSAERIQNNYKTCDRSCAGKYSSSKKVQAAVEIVQTPEIQTSEIQPTVEPEGRKMSKSVKRIHYSVCIKNGSSEEIYRSFRREDTAQMCLYGLRKEGKTAVIRKAEELEISEETLQEFLTNELKAMP